MTFGLNLEMIINKFILSEKVMRMPLLWYYFSLVYSIMVLYFLKY